MAPNIPNPSTSSVDPDVTSIVNPSSPLYLLASDSASTTLVTTTFNGTGYKISCRGLFLGLSCKNKLGLINISVPKPSPTDPFFHAWVRRNDMVISGF